jgi:hypothetical protein
MNWDEAHLQGDLEAMQQAREEAIVRAALDRAAERIAYQRGTIYDEDNLETMAWVRGNNSAVSSALAITWSIASSPAEVAAIIKAAKEDRG